VSADRTAALRARSQEQQNQPADRQAAIRPTARPADLVITSDMIPVPVQVEATGQLTADEIDSLGTCERAVENLGTATWLAGKALQTIRDGKLYRHSHRTFEDYITERWEISERNAYLMIEEWPLAERLNQSLGKPATASHTRALLPVGERFGLNAATEMYQQLQARAQTEHVRLTGAMTAQVVKAVLKTTGRQTETVHFQQAAHQLITVEALPLSPPRGLASPLRPRQIEAAAPPADIPTSVGSSALATPDPTSEPGPGTVAVAASLLQNFAGDHGKVTTFADAVPAQTSTLPVTEETAPPAASHPRAVTLFREIHNHISAIERCLRTEAIGPATEDEAAEFNQLADDVIRRLRGAVHALEHDI
jgi:hypothetical protein